MRAGRPQRSVAAAAMVAAVWACGGSAFKNPGDAGGGVDAGPPGACANSDGGQVRALCTDAELNASVRTAAGDARVIRAPDNDPGAPYAPNCMVVKAGQTVTWRGKLSSHPLVARGSSSSPNPIPATANGTEVAVTFPCPGDFNFACKNHGGTMEGTIRVLP